MDDSSPQSQIQQKSKKTRRTHGRFFLLSIIPFLVYSLGFVPPIVTVKLLLYVIHFNRLIDFILLPFIISLVFFLTLVSQILISGAIIRIFKINYSEGTFEYSVNNPVAFRWMLFCQMYTPMRKILEIVPMGKIKTTYLRLVGMKIGENSLVGGVIKDPCMTEIGDNVTIGEYAILYAHIHDYGKGTITIQKIKVGSACVIGAGALIMPGVIMEDHTVAGAGAVVPKNRVLEKDKIYGGNPAKEINGTPKKQEEGTQQ